MCPSPLSESSEKRELTLKLSRGIRWLVSTTIITQLVSWALTVGTARILKPSDYGLLALNEVLYPYFILLSTFRIEQWAVQRKIWNRSTERDIFPLLLAFGFISAGIGFIGAYGIAAFYDDPEALLPFQLCAGMYLLRSLQVIPEVRLKRAFAMKEIATMNMVIGIGRGALQLSLAYSGWSYWSLVIGNILAETLRTIWLWRVSSSALVAKSPSTSPSQTYSLIREALTFGAHASGAYMFWVLFSTADNVVVGKFFGREILGLYSMAFYFIDLPLSKLSGIISPLTLPYFARLRESPHLLNRAFLRSTLVMMAIISPILIGLSAVAQDFSSIVLGPKWSGFSEILTLLSIVGVLRAAPTFVQSALTAYGRSRELFLSAMIPGLLLPLSFVTLSMVAKEMTSEHPQLGGIYFSWLVIYPVVGIYLPLRYLGIPIQRFLVIVVPPLICSALMYFSVSCTILVMEPGITRLALSVVIGALSYFTSMWIIYRKTSLTLLAMLRKLRNSR